MFGANEMRRMFGDAVCHSLVDDECVLTPPAKVWATSVNESLKGGVCEGFAVFSMLLFNTWVDSQQFGDESAINLSLTDNGALKHELAYWFATQFLEDPVIDQTHAYDAKSAVIHLANVFHAGRVEDYVRIGLARLDDSGALVGGHALTPFAVVDGDTPDSKWIMVYDSNHPSMQEQISVNMSDNSWSYQASENPAQDSSLYVGNVANKNKLYLAPLFPRLGVQPCTFCNASTNGSESIRSMGQMRRMILHGPINALIEDDNGLRVGNVDGQWVNEIPGAVTMPGASFDFWADDAPTQIIMPTGTPLSVSLTSRAVGEGAAEIRRAVRLFTPGYVLGLEYPVDAEDIADVLDLPGDASGISLTSSGTSPGTLFIGHHDGEKGVLLRVGMVGAGDGSKLTLQNNTEEKIMTFTVESDDEVTLQIFLIVHRNGDSTPEVFEGTVVSSGSDKIKIEYGLWEGGDHALTFATDVDSNGDYDVTEEVTNSHDYELELVDECAEMTHSCSVYATCTDTPGGHTCDCDDGYIGDGQVCYSE